MAVAGPLMDCSLAAIEHCCGVPSVSEKTACPASALATIGLMAIVKTLPV